MSALDGSSFGVDSPPRGIDKKVDTFGLLLNGVMARENPMRVAKTMRLVHLILISC